MLNKAIGFLRLRLISRRWAPATRVSQGTKEEFSTGSHAQNPPKLNASYAQAPPIKIPVPRMPMPKMDQRSAGFIHERSERSASPANAYANGMDVEAKPKKRVGG